MELTKGEAILLGLEQIREGLQMVRQASRDVDLIRFELSKPFDPPKAVNNEKGAQK